MDAPLILSQIIVYPIKSLAGVQMQQWWVEERGFRHDRRWLIIDDANRFVTQREYPQMVLIDVALRDEGIVLHHRTRSMPTLRVPYTPETSERLTVQIWNDEVEAVVVGAVYNQWLTEALGFSARLVFMPDSSPRPVDEQYAIQPSNVSFADGYPYLLIGQASLDDLNTRLPSPIEMRRFRPNLVVEGSLPYEEDHWYEFRIGQFDCYGVKPCARCILTTVNPDTGSKDGVEPVKTLATYRKANNKIFFGQNVLIYQAGLLGVGDEVSVLSRQQRVIAV
jgi:uncharacterized protein